MPPSNSNYYKDQDIDIIDKLRSDIIKYSSQGQIIIIGDLNSRLGNLQEEFSFINDDPDAQSTIDNIESLPVREFMDPSTNQPGRKLMDLLNESSLISLNGRKLEDTSGKQTCHQYSGSSTVDLNIVSWDLYDKVQYFRVLDPVWYFDHCPIEMSLSIGHILNQIPINRDDFIPLDQDFQQSEKASYQFSEMLQPQPIQQRLKHEVVDYAKPGIDPNVAVDNFNKIIFNVSEECLTPKLKFSFKKNTRKCNKWMNESCFKAKKEFYKVKQEFIKFPSNMGRRLVFMNAKKKYKKPSTL